MLIGGERIMRRTKPLAAAFVFLTLAGPAFTGSAQTAQPKPELLLFHPSGPVPSYEVATVKLLNSNTADRVVKLPPGVMARTFSPLSIRHYIMNAYGAIYAAQIVGGPDWINKDAYDINGKVPDDLQAAFQKMTFVDRNDQTRATQQSLLSDRFHLKAHFETRVLPVYELVPAKGGLKITTVPAPPESKAGDPPVHVRNCYPQLPGSLGVMLNSKGLRVVNGCAINIQSVIRPIGPDAGDRPIVDHSGFTGYFDIKGLAWAPLGDADASNAPDAPSLSEALEHKLGLKLVSAKDPIEVLVIDSIDRPSPN
jgi:uncharacterized protein (TIGR03435 family)